MSQRHPQDDMVLHRQLHDLRTLQGALTMCRGNARDSSLGEVPIVQAVRARS
jgi:hypothetical protein